MFLLNGIFLVYLISYIVKNKMKQVIEMIEKFKKIIKQLKKKDDDDMFLETESVVP